MRSFICFCVLAGIKLVGHLTCRYQAEWLADRPWGWWRDIRVLAFLNHTSLYEPLFAGFAPTGLLWAFARHGVLPVAEKTMRRPIGLFFRFLVRHPVIITRQRDHTWDRVLHRIGTRSLVIILPEGRMKRRNGLDSSGKPMTVRGGIADILEPLDSGSMLVVYSGGLHHIQAPGELVPRPFRTIRSRFDILDIARFKAEVEASRGDDTFKTALIRNLEWRRDAFCPPPPGAIPGPKPAPELSTSLPT